MGGNCWLSGQLPSHSHSLQNIAHDLRTPLSRLRRRLDMLRINGQKTDQHAELLDQAINKADGLLTTFKALLRISKVESGRRRGGFEDVDITALLDDLIELYEPLSEEKGQTLVSERPQIQSLQGRSRSALSSICKCSR